MPRSSRMFSAPQPVPYWEREGEEWEITVLPVSINLGHRASGGNAPGSFSLWVALDQDCCWGSLSLPPILTPTLPLLLSCLQSSLLHRSCTISVFVSQGLTYWQHQLSTSTTKTSKSLKRHSCWLDHFVVGLGLFMRSWYHHHIYPWGADGLENTGCMCVCVHMQHSLCMEWFMDMCTISIVTDRKLSF